MRRCDTILARGVMAGYIGKQGRRPLPTALKVLRGNPGGRPLNDAEPQPKKSKRLPSPPDELSDAAKKEWRRTGKMLFDAGLVTDVDVAQLAIYCAAYAQWLQATETLAKTPMLVKTKNGDLKANPLLKIAREAAFQTSRALVEFGMSPSSRSRVKGDPKEEEADPFEQWRTGA